MNDAWIQRLSLPGGLLGLSAALFCTVGAPASRAEGQDLDLGRIPVGYLEFKFTTCDEENAGTNDRVELVIQTTSSKKTYILDNPGDDRERNQRDSYMIEGVKRLSDIRAITVRKHGNDGWCISRMDVFANGHTSYPVFGWNKDSSGLTTAGVSYAGTHAGATWPIRIDDDSADAPAPYVTFTDSKVATYTKGSTATQIHPNPLPMRLIYRTCADSWSDTTDSVKLSWTHDGGRYEEATLPIPAPGNSASIWLDMGVDTDSIETMKVSKGGTDAVCLDSFIATNGFANAFVNQTRFVLDLTQAQVDAKERATATILSTPKTAWVYPTAGAWGYRGLPLKRGGEHKRINDWLDAVPTNDWSVCAPPDGFYSYEIEKFVGMMIRQEFDSNTSWDDPSGYVQATQKDSKTVHVKARFENHEGFDTTVFLNMDLTPGCRTETVNGKTVNKLELVPSNLTVVPDTRVGNFILAIFSPSIRERFIASFVKLQNISFDTPSAAVSMCPTTNTVVSSGGIVWGWPSIIPENYLCMTATGQQDAIRDALGL